MNSTSQVRGSPNKRCLEEPGSFGWRRHLSQDMGCTVEEKAEREWEGRKTITHCSWQCFVPKTSMNHRCVKLRRKQNASGPRIMKVPSRGRVCSGETELCVGRKEVSRKVETILELTEPGNRCGRGWRVKDLKSQGGAGQRALGQRHFPPSLMTWTWSPEPTRQKETSKVVLWPPHVHHAPICIHTHIHTHRNTHTFYLNYF